MYIVPVAQIDSKNIRFYECSRELDQIAEKRCIFFEKKKKSNSYE